MKIHIFLDIKTVLLHTLLSMEEPRLRAAAFEIVKRLSESGKKLCAAESCTGGLVASSIVSVDNASRAFNGSAVCYCDDAKRAILHVPAEILEKYFAESPECAAEMARGALDIFNADIAVSATGFLDANTPPQKKDVAGRVFFGLATRGKSVKTFELDLDVSKPRNEKRTEAALKALEIVLENINEIPSC